MGFEFTILDSIQSMRTPFFDWLMPIITAMGDGGAVWLVMTALLLIFPKTRKTGMVILLGLAIQAILCNVVLKPLTARIRPYDVNTAIQLLIEPQWDYSFPSGHTAASFAAAWGLEFMGKRRLATAAMILACLIAFSRLYLYVHYPTDVIAGILIGAGSAWCGMKLLPILTRKFRSPSEDVMDEHK